MKHIRINPPAFLDSWHEAQLIEDSRVIAICGHVHPTPQEAAGCGAKTWPEASRRIA